MALRGVRSRCWRWYCTQSITALKNTLKHLESTSVGSSNSSFISIVIVIALIVIVLINIVIHRLAQINLSSLLMFLIITIIILYFTLTVL